MLAYYNNILNSRVYLDSYTIGLRPGEIYYLKATKKKAMCIVLAEEKGVYLCKYYVKGYTWYGRSHPTGLTKMRDSKYY